MAVRNHSTAESYNVGELKLSVIDFTDIDNGDTYDSNIVSPVAYWATATDDPTINRETAAVSYNQVNGQFTFSTSEDNRVVKLYVLSRG